MQIQKYLKLKNFTSIETRFKEISIFILLKVLIDPKTFFRFFNHSLYLIYIFKYIEYVNPRCVINFIDNDLKFYSLKKYFKNIRFISIQNGLRTIQNDILGQENFINSENLACDYYLVFNKNIAKKLSSKIDAKYIVFGSIKNNFYLKGLLKKKSEVLYISQFRSSKNISYRNKELSQKKSEIDHEKKLLNNVIDFCNRNKKKLNILSTFDRKNHQFLKENNYYKRIILSKNWKMIPSNRNSIKANNYALVDSFEVTLATYSTLGYESLGRGNKVAFFSTKLPNDNSKLFGWPYCFPKKGNFYSDINNSNEVNRVLNYLFKISKNSWKVEANKFQINLIKRFNGIDKLRKIIQ